MVLKSLNNKKKRANVLRAIAKLSPFPLVYASNFLQSSGGLKMGTNYVKNSELAKLIRAKFEDAEFLIPQGWDACLKRQYGDYMQMPPVEKRASHHKVIPQPFTPCNHSEILYWKDRKSVRRQSLSE
jgi:lipopolysaccharide cholinephosphotransferase